MIMQSKYKKWITENVKDVYGKCNTVTDLMLEEFPELIKVRGHYYCSTWGEREHWWCKTRDNEVIDPTALQFPSKGKGVYIEFKEGAREPTGKCMNCSEYCYNGENTCSKNCEIELDGYYRDLI